MAFLIDNRRCTLSVLLLLASCLPLIGKPTAAADKVVVVPLIDTSKGVVPRTGQTTCYQHEFPHPVIPCAGTGQDGELQKGIAWPVPRFTDNLNGTVTDHLSGLVWLKNADCLNGTRNRAQALEFAENLYDGYVIPGGPLSDCDLSDGSTAGQWRIPNRFELESLLDLSQDAPALPSGHFFTNVRTDHDYWTSSFLAWSVNLGIGWAVTLHHGFVNASDWEEDKCYVWLVRDGL